MRVTPPIKLDSRHIISTNVSAIHDPAEYSPTEEYSAGALIKVAADYSIYESLYDDNLGNKPSELTWWKKIGPTETLFVYGNTYGIGQTVSYNNRCYESLAANNVNHYPPSYPEKETDYWYDLGPTNRWAMFDLERNSQTVWSEPIVVTVKPLQRINTVAVGGMKANSLEVSASSIIGGGLVYPNEFSVSSTGIFDLNTREVRDGFEYAFAPFSTKSSNVIFDIPTFSDVEVTITITATSGNVKCGSVVLGTYAYIGDVLQYAKADSLNFSEITRDIYGTATLVKRKSYPKTDQTLLLNSNRLNQVMAVKDSLNAEPALWTGLDDNTSDWFEMLQIMGIYKEFNFTHESQDKVKVSLSLEEI